jgi:hypothetical protein
MSRTLRFARRLTTRVLLSLLACLLVSAAATAQDKPTGTTGNSMSAEEKAMMDVMMKAATPGPNHQLLTSISGDWTFKIRMWMNPSAPATESTGTVAYTPLLGGRYVQGQYRGDMMGMPFEGLGLMGYDNVSAQFQTSWVDNMGTMITFLTGTYDPATKAITYTGRMDDATQPGTKVKVRQVIRIESPDSHVMEWYETRDGKETKTMEIVYTRTK